MESSQEFPKHVKNLLNLWSESDLSKFKNLDVQNHIQQSNFLNSLAVSKDNYVAFTSHYDNTVLSYSENMKEYIDFGFTHENLVQNGMGAFLSLIPKEQCLYLENRKRFEMSMRVHFNKNFDDVNFVCGYILENKDGSERILSNLTIPVEYFNFRPVVVIHIFTDISHLVKDKTKWWARFEAKSYKLKTIYKSENPKFLKTDILAKRQLEIIKLFEQGFDMSEISEKLNISYNTTDNHRKKIILKTNAINITAAIQLLKIGTIL
jgi:DNA-binding CsgD family transcriptional regulator